ncbi:LysR family transcriptional regulator [Egbenema bharatensis]|uniref:LysR family transcriptional regulator n=1 Tax=Egbenema bharatensis TaxID=3463334 RepID=UPI003A89997F
MDKFEQLKAFTRVVDTGGFAAAARQMGLSRSAVNKLVIQLENDLGVQLLHRSTRRVIPSETGLAFYERCQAILADLAEAEQSVSQLQEEPKGTLRVNAPMSFGTLHLAPAIVDFMLKYPDVRVQLTLDDRLVDPIQEGFDLLVRIAEPPDSAALIVHSIAPARRFLCASPEYLNRYGTPTHPNDLQQHHCLHYGYLGTREQWKLVGQEGEFWAAINSVLCSNNGEVLRDAALKGLGIAILPTFIIGSDLQQNLLQVVLPDYAPPSITICIIYPANRHLSTKIQLFTQFIKERFGEKPYWDDKSG